jgi:hypothetical protein
MRGEYVTVVDQLENDGWWKGISESGATGIFPSNFVQIIEDDRPPQRPVRARPATVKTENTENMAKPPPVPVTTRPTSLLSNRDSSSPSVPRPITTPPRPTTSPPIPTRRSNSIISPTTNTNTTTTTTAAAAAGERGHRRIPSIPLTAPDLPPISPVHEQRPSRPIPRPTSSNDSMSTSPLSPRSARPPELSANTLQHMAKPPKVNFKSPPPVRSPTTSRPCSINDAVATGESHPAVPKRSMPPVPETRSSPEIKSTKPTTALPSTPIVANDDDELDPALEAKLRQLVKIETEKIRKEFETRLEDERIERLRFQVEFEELKARLSLSSSE